MFKSRTHKFRYPGSDHAVYFTIARDDNGHVEAMFINSKEMGSFQWVTSLLTSYIRYLRTEDYTTKMCRLLKDMKETFDPHGDYETKDFGKVNSLVHHIALILECDNQQEESENEI